jgi:hypothetical protein
MGFQFLLKPRTMNRSSDTGFALIQALRFPQLKSVASIS